MSRIYMHLHSERKHWRSKSREKGASRFLEEYWNYPFLGKSCGTPSCWGFLLGSFLIASLVTTIETITLTDSNKKYMIQSHTLLNVADNSGAWDIPIEVFWNWLKKKLKNTC